MTNEVFEISQDHKPQESRDHDVIYSLRTVHQYQSQLLILADQKANILNGIVAIVLTIFFTNTSFLTNVDEVLKIPFTMFVVIEALAMCLALFVVMPKLTSGYKPTSLDEIPNLFFFGYYTRFKEDDFVDYLGTHLKCDEEARKLLARDIYQIGMVLKNKYAYLKYAYLSALIGVIFLVTSSSILLFQKS